ncbi:MAG: hypothetical protein RL033_1888 [Pseudomonadota bacterium]|jgi:nicotinamidase-related amidase
MQLRHWLLLLSFPPFASLVGLSATASATPAATANAPTTVRALYGLHAPARLSAAKTALLLVDFQDEFFHGRLPLPEGPAAVQHAARLLDWARRSRLLVVHVRNVVTRAGSPMFVPGTAGVRSVPELLERPEELVLTKSLPGAFSRTELDQKLRERGIDTVIIAGLMTHLAVTTTASDATVLGYQAIVAGQATATRALPGAGR